MNNLINSNHRADRLSKAQKKIWGLIEPLLTHQSFLEEVEFIKTTPGHSRPIHISNLMLAYKIPTSAYKFIEHIIETGEHDKSLIDIPIEIISTHDQTIEPSDDPAMAWKRYKVADAKYVGLIFNYDVTQQEIVEFVNKNYSKYIKPKLLNISGPRKSRRPRPYAARDARIYKAYERGVKAKDIGAKENLSAEDVRVIVGRQKAYHSRTTF